MIERGIIPDTVEVKESVPKPHFMDGIMKIFGYTRSLEPEVIPEPVRNIRAWGKEECDRLEREYPIHTSYELMEMFDRSYKSINTKAERMGLKKR